MRWDTSPIRAIAWDSPLVDVQAGDLMPVDGHSDHLAALREMTFDGKEIWLRIKCTCGETFGGAFTRQRLGIQQWPTLQASGAAAAAHILDRCRALIERGTKPSLPEVKPLVDAYYKLPGFGAGGSLHVVLDDGNHERGHIEWCVEYASRHQDAAGAELGRVLLLLSRSQLRRL